MKASLPAATDEIVSSVTVSVEIPNSYDKVFSIVSDPFQLPKWAKPIKSVRRVESGEIEVDYELSAGPLPCPTEKTIDEAKGIVDYIVRPPNAPQIKVYSRVISLAPENTLYVFTLQSPAMPKRKLKNAQEIVRKNLAQDLENLRAFILTERKQS